MVVFLAKKNVVIFSLDNCFEGPIFVISETVCA